MNGVEKTVQFKWFIATILMALGMFAFAATPQVKNVKAMQQYPWGKVYISYEVVGDIAASAGSGKTPFLFVTAKDKTTGKLCGAISAGESYLSGDIGTSVGSHKVVWDVAAQGLTINAANVAFTITYCDEVYLIADLSAGANASSYPISYLYAIPSGGWTDAYKTTKLVLRRLPAGTFKMQGTSNVTLTKPFYMGVFEVTQKQYTLVMGESPSSGGDKSPVEKASYLMIRGSAPSSLAVGADSFLGKLRMRAGLDFDLPTEAQWEYACRAGTTSDYNNGGNTEEDLKKLGRYGGNRPQAYGQTIANVGSYLPNAWGLYDMHGNVWERCLDWYGPTLEYGTDPRNKNNRPDNLMVMRGGSWCSGAEKCTSSYRVYSGMSDTGVPYEAYCYPGFRLSMTP